MKLLAATVILISLYTIGIAQTNISGIINTYTSYNGHSQDTIDVSSSTGFSVGDKVLIIQMQGATINQSNASSFGTVTNINDAGNYEFTTVCEVLSNQLVVTGVDRTYTTNGKVQVVRVPVYTNANVNGVLSASPWNGTTGGVLAFECTGTLTLNDDIDLDGLGFRGGATTTSTFACAWFLNSSGYFYNISSGEGAKKGEGIASYISGKTGGRGPQASGGGGSNDHNGGGGGGANAGSGGLGGQRIAPSTFSCSCTSPGIGGNENNYSTTQNRVFLGGGGGAGHENNANTSTDGENGGGVAIITAATLVSSGYTISSRGLSVTSNSADGAGGGGAGGTILLDISNYSGSVTADVSGGDGGDVSNVGNNCNGPGGGGGGGVVWVSQSTLPSNISVSNGGGNSGTTISSTQSNCSINGTNSATAGSDGETLTGLSISESVCSNPIIAKMDTICAGDSLFLEGDWRFSSGTYNDVFSSGCCDSTIETNLTVLDFKSGYLSDSICAGESLIINGTNYSSDTTGAIEIFTGIGPFGCDSMVTIDIFVTDIDTSVVHISPTLSAAAYGHSYQWLRCPDYEIIPDSTNQTFTASENGSYALVITKNGCSDTSGCYEIKGLGILESNFGESFSLYPNPTKGNIHLSWGNRLDEVCVHLYDVSGRLLQNNRFLNQESATIELNQASGIYLLVIESKLKRATIQVIKQ